MKKAEIDLLHHHEVIEKNNPLLVNPPKTPQQHFLMTYLGLRLLENGEDMPILAVLLTPLNGSFSQLLLHIKYMRKCMDKGQLLDNNNFHILRTLILWMQQQEKNTRNPKINLIYSMLLPHPNQLHLQQFEELIVYLNYIALDVIKILKVGDIEADDLLQLLEVILPRIYYNIILTLDSLGEDSQQTEDVLFYNQSLEFFTRTSNNYRALCRAVMRHLLTLTLKQNQMRELLERTCRYYLLFWKDHKQSTDFFLAAFEKATEAARFSLIDEFVLFFKMIGKLGDTHLQKLMRSKYEWIDNLLNRFGAQSIVGHPKGQVNPFNVIGIKQNIKVEAGKSAHRLIEIYHQYSLFYFKVDIEAHDISVRLFYLGDFESKVQVKKLLLTQDKVSTQLRSAFIAAKKGLYLIEFDNTYSWLNAKNLKFQYILLVQYKAYDYPIWMKTLFDIKESEKNNNKKENIEIKDIEEKKIDLHDVGERKIEVEDHPTHQSPQSAIIEDKFKPEEPKEQPEKINLQQQQILEQNQNIPENGSLHPINHSETVPKTSHIPQQVSQLPQASDQICVQQAQHQIIEQQVKVEQVQYEERHDQPENIPIVEKENHQNQREKQQQLRVEEVKSEVVEIKSSHSLPSQEGSDKIDWGQANLSLIDNIFSLLVNIQDHTYQFQTNLEDRIIKRLKAYCQGQDKLHWIFNSQARDWLKKRGFMAISKNGVTLLHTAEQGKLK